MSCERAVANITCPVRVHQINLAFISLVRCTVSVAAACSLQHRLLTTSALTYINDPVGVAYQDPVTETLPTRHTGTRSTDP